MISPQDVEFGASLDEAEATVTYNILPINKRKPIGVTQITIYKTDEIYTSGKLVAANNTWMCYGVKGDMIRVISTGSGLKLLLRLHKAPVHDMVFLHASLPDASEQLLVSLARDGLCAVWKLESTTPIMHSLVGLLK